MERILPELIVLAIILPVGMLVLGGFIKAGMHIRDEIRRNKEAQERAERASRGGAEQAGEG